MCRSHVYIRKIWHRCFLDLDLGSHPRSFQTIPALHVSTCSIHLYIYIEPLVYVPRRSEAPTTLVDRTIVTFSFIALFSQQNEKIKEPRSSRTITTSPPVRSVRVGAGFIGLRIYPVHRIRDRFPAKSVIGSLRLPNTKILTLLRGLSTFGNCFLIEAK